MLHGTASKAEEEAYRARGVTEAPGPPEFLPVKARELWEKLAPDLAATGRLSEEMAPAMTSLCLAYFFMLWSMNTLARDGMMDVDPAHENRRRKHPAYQMWRDAQAAFRGWAAEFGITPASRTRIEAGALESSRERPFDQFLVR